VTSYILVEYIYVSDGITASIIMYLKVEAVRLNETSINFSQAEQYKIFLGFVYLQRRSHW
jgi:hypothetical protein